MVLEGTKCVTMENSDSELNERLIKSIEGSAKTVIFGRLVDKN